MRFWNPLRRRRDHTISVPINRRETVSVEVLVEKLWDNLDEGKAIDINKVITADNRQKAVPLGLSPITSVESVYGDGLLVKRYLEHENSVNMFGLYHEPSYAGLFARSDVLAGGPKDTFYGGVSSVSFEYDAGREIMHVKNYQNLYTNDTLREIKRELGKSASKDIIKFAIGAKRLILETSLRYVDERYDFSEVVYHKQGLGKGYITFCDVMAEMDYDVMDNGNVVRAAFNLP